MYQVIKICLSIHHNFDATARVRKLTVLISEGILILSTSLHDLRRYFLDL